MLEDKGTSSSSVYLSGARGPFPKALQQTYPDISLAGII